MDHRFGGSWTEIKLARLHSYLQAYRQIFRKNKRARYFKTWFVDAFAGTGARVDSTVNVASTLFDDVYTDADTGRYREGSANIALGLADPFDYYLLIEKSVSRLKALKEHVAEAHAALNPRCSFKLGDANEVLRQWCGQRNWEKERAVVFLDPYGMQVEWTTVQILAATKAVDLWYLFPLGVGVSRLLTHSGNMEESWQSRLDLLFGTMDWRQRFYRTNTTMNLFGETHHTLERSATPAIIEAYIHERLSTCFEGVAKGLILKNSRGNPMYLLCFAAANKRGAPTALRIVKHILEE